MPPLPLSGRFRSERWAALAELGLIGGAFFLYNGLRGLMDVDAASAAERAADWFALERTLGLDWESSLQSSMYSLSALVDAANSLYLYGHGPVIGVAAIWLYVAHRPVYRRLRNVVFLSGAIGLVIFALAPVAPPRLAPDLGFRDSIQEQYHASRVLWPSVFTNEYAAVPSLHVGWNALVALAAWRATRRWSIRLPLAAIALGMAWAVVATGNHFVLDVVAGLAVVGVAMLLIAAWRRFGPKLGGSSRARRTASGRSPVLPA